MASTIQLKLSLYGLNPWPVSQVEVGHSRCGNLNHQYFCHVIFFLLNSIIIVCAGSEDRLSLMNLRCFLTLWTILQPVFTQILKAKKKKKKTQPKKQTQTKKTQENCRSNVSISSQKRGIKCGMPMSLHVLQIN